MMRVSCDRLKLSEAFSVVSSLATKGSSREALQCVKLDVRAGSVTLSATNFDTSIRLELDGAEPLESTPLKAADGAALLHVGRVGQIIRETPDDRLKFELANKPGEDGDFLRISSLNSEFKLPVIDPKEFPAVKAWEETDYLELPVRWLREAIRRTAFATDPNSTRFALGGVRLEMTDECSLTLIATDGRRLAKVNGSATKVGNPGVHGIVAAIVPTPAMVLVSKTLGDSDAAVKLAIHGNDVVFFVGGVTVTTRQVEGRYPNWRSVLPTRDNPSKISLNVGSAHNVIRQAAIVADSESRGLDFELTSGSLLLSASTADLGRSHVELPIAYEGQPIHMKMDYRFVCDFLKALDATDSFTLDVVSSTASALLTTDDGYSYVVMPMALDRPIKPAAAK
jgi:DNA polymerase-3 subunit beta